MTQITRDPGIKRPGITVGSICGNLRRDFEIDGLKSKEVFKKEKLSEPH